MAAERQFRDPANGDGRYVRIDATSERISTWTADGTTQTGQLPVLSDASASALEAKSPAEVANISKTLMQFQSGRFTAFGNGTWSTNDENFGATDENWNENRGTVAADPTWLWNDMGHTMLPGGAVVEQVFVKMRCNNVSVTDWTWLMAAAYPTAPTANASGYDNVAEITVEDIIRSDRSTWTNPPPTGATNDWHHQSFTPNYTVPATHDMADIRMALRATTTNTTNRFVYFVGSMIVRLP